MYLSYFTYISRLSFNEDEKVNNKKQLGQGMTEYIIITALIAVAAIAAYSYFGQTLQQQVAGMASEMSGNSAKDHIKDAQTAAASAATNADKKTNLGNYDSSGNSAVK